MSINGNCRFIAVAWKNGIIVIYDIEQDPPVVQLISQDCEGQQITELKWPIDGGSSFIALTETGSVYYFLATGSKQQENFKFLPKELNEILPCPPFLSDYFDYTVFMRSQSEPDPKMNYRITQAYLYPSFNIFGFQTSILLGSQSGLILKFNSNKGHFEHHQQHEIYLSKHSKIISKKDQIPIKDFPITHNESDLVLTTGKKHIFREFFDGHENKILYLGNLDKSETLVSVDIAGFLNIWDYDSTGFKDANTFGPKKNQRYHISVD